MFGLGCGFSGVVLTCFTLSPSAVFTDVSLIKLENLFEAVFYSLAYVKKFVNRLMFAQTSRCLLHLLLPKLAIYSQ